MDIANLALVCPRHHTEVHAGTWTITMIDAIPRVQAPPGSTPTNPCSATLPTTPRHPGWPHD